ncbi:hypothetical protein M422DRAFT_239244 [Sphaerobolus stellatus SS14]|nr:hypothetical protein M422DRAFT_239244 [Sphaerobolus stellatus SS14]
MAGYCTYEPMKALHKEFCGEAEDKIRTCMMTLASSKELPAPVYDSVVSTILSGGKKAVGK